MSAENNMSVENDLIGSLLYILLIPNSEKACFCTTGKLKFAIQL